MLETKVMLVKLNFKSIEGTYDHYQTVVSTFCNNIVWK